jgi:excisionase family DNA binding protein
VVIVADRVVERHLAAAVGAYVDALRRNGVRPPVPLLELRAALCDLNRHEPTEFAGPNEFGEGDGMALVFDTNEVADVLRVSQRSVERLLAAGDLPSVLIGRSRRVRAEDLREYVAELPTTREKINDD